MMIDIEYTYVPLKIVLSMSSRGKIYVGTQLFLGSFCLKAFSK